MLICVEGSAYLPLQRENTDPRSALRHNALLSGAGRTAAWLNNILEHSWRPAVCPSLDTGGWGGESLLYSRELQIQFYTSHSLKGKENSQSHWGSFSHMDDTMDHPHSQESIRLAIAGDSRGACSGLESAQGWGLSTSS